MNADREIDLHAGSAEAHPFEEETRAIIGCAFEVMNQLGHGLNEKCYENALAVEFRLHNIPYAQQKPFEVVYKSAVIGTFVPDMIAFNNVIVDAKVID